MKTTTVDTAERGRSPLGAHIRFLMDGLLGNMIHSTVPSGMVGRACRFQSIDDDPGDVSLQVGPVGVEHDPDAPNRPLEASRQVDIPPSRRCSGGCRRTVPLGVEETASDSPGLGVRTPRHPTS